MSEPYYIPGALGVEPRSQVNKMNTTVKPGVNDTQKTESQEYGN